MPTNEPQIKAYSIEAFCQAYSIGRTSVFQEIKEGKLKTIRKGRRTLIPQKYAEEWLYNEKGGSNE